MTQDTKSTRSHKSRLSVKDWSRVARSLGPPFSDRRPFLGLRVKLISGVILIIVIIVVGMTFVLLERNAEDLSRQMNVEAMTVARSLAEAIAVLDPLAVNLPPQEFRRNLERLCDAALQSPNIDAALVITPDLEVIAGTHEPATPPDFAGVDLALQRRDIHPQRLEAGGRRIEPALIVSAPIVVDTLLLGVVQVQTNLGVIEREFQYSRRNTVQFIIIECLIIIVFTSLLLNIIVIRPVYRLVDATKEIAEGNLEERVDVVTTDEIGELAESFNRMTAQLERSRSKVDEYVVSLEETNRELQKAHQELITSEKQASIGRLAAGVAHEIGNPLSSLLGFTEILQIGAGTQEDRSQYLKDMQEEIQRISRIVRDLLDFSRQRELTLKPVDINPVMERTARLLLTLPEFREVDVRLNLAPDLPLILLEENLLQQVATNIMVNAAQAMDGTGTLTVTTRAGDACEIVFEDTGPGIPEAVITHVFEPFYTTKDVGVGTGLGLSVSLNLIESCGGTIVAENTEEGARFVIRFPAATYAEGDEVHAKT